MSLSIAKNGVPGGQTARGQGGKPFVVVVSAKGRAGME